jgi:putative ABC transport system permease protein
MSRLFSASLRKSLSDVTRRKGRSLLVVLGIFIGIFGLTCINYTEDTLVSAFAFTLGYQSTQPDYQLMVNKLDSSLLPELRAVTDVKTVQYESDFAACWKLISTDRCVVNLVIKSFPDLRHVPMTPFQLTGGSYPGVGQIVMEQGDQSLANVNIGDSITLHVPGHVAQLRVSGLARTPGVSPSTTGDAVAYMSDAGLQQLVLELGNPVDTGPNGQQFPRYQHHIVIKFVNTSRAQESVAAAGLQQVLASHGVTVLGSGFAPRVDASTLDTINGVFNLLRTLALVAVVLDALLILSTITILVTDQTAIIGAMKAMGGSRAAIMRGYLTTVAIYSLLSTLPAIGLGLYVGNTLATSLAPQIPLELGPFAVSVWVVATSLVVGFGVPLLAALLPLWNGTRLTVREALSAYGVGLWKEPSALGGLSQRLTWVSATTWLGLRGLFRKRWRALLSLSTLTLAAASFLVVQTATASVNGTIGAVDAPVFADMTVHFSDSTLYSRIQSQLEALANLQRVERTGSTNASTQWGVLQVSGYEPDTQIYHYQLTSGRWFQDGDTNVVLLSDSAARKSGLKVGDTLTLTNNYGSSTALSVTMIGTVKQSIDVLGWIGAAVLPVDTLYRLEGLSTEQAATGTQEITIEARDRSLPAVDHLAAEVSGIVNGPGAYSDGTGYYDGQGGTIDTIHEYTTRRQGDAYVLYYLLYALALIVGAVGVLGLANMLVAAVLERRREIGLLRAMGASGRRVAEVFLVESLALGGISWFAGALIGLPLAYAFVQMFASEVMPVDFYLDPLAFVVMLAAILLIAALASLAPSWRASRLGVAGLLRYE